MQKLISIDLFADFGMLKKPDTNEPVYLTFNMLHKPAFLGIVGAIIGLEGFKEKGRLPEYYIKLKDLKIGIEPIEKDEKTGTVFNENGNFQKTVLKYNNTTGFANKSEGNSGATLNIEEQFLIAPAFRCYLYFDGSIESELEEKIYSNLKNNHAEYLPYLGKNEFSIWWDEFKEYDFENFKPSENFKINSIFIKEKPVKDGKAEEYFCLFSDLTDKGNSFIYFERLPVSYQEIAKKQYQYDYLNFSFTDWSLEQNNKPENFPILKLKNNDKNIQVF